MGNTVFYPKFILVGGEMTRFKHYLIVTAVFALLTTIGAIMNSREAVAQNPTPGSAPVTVQNTSANPVPVTGNVGIAGTTNVTITNTAVPIQNVGGGAATHVGQVASEIVNLFCFAQSCFQIFPNGTRATTNYAVPSAKALVLTDVQWGGTNLPTSEAGLYFSVQLQVNGLPVAFFSSTVDRVGDALGQAHLSTGVVVLPGSTIGLSLPTLSSGAAIVQGYLVPNK
jgi:hypothetical protein